MERADEKCIPNVCVGIVEELEAERERIVYLFVDCIYVYLWINVMKEYGFFLSQDVPTAYALAYCIFGPNRSGQTNG